MIPLPATMDNDFLWLNVRTLEYAGSRGRMTEDEKNLHQLGASLVSEFWRKHQDITVRSLNERVVPFSDLLLSNRDDRRVYEMTIDDNVRVVCKKFTLVRALESNSPGHIIRNTYKVNHLFIHPFRM